MAFTEKLKRRAIELYAGLAAGSEPVDGFSAAEVLIVLREKIPAQRKFPCDDMIRHWAKDSEKGPLPKGRKGQSNNFPKGDAIRLMKNMLDTYSESLELNEKLLDFALQNSFVKPEQVRLCSSELLDERKEILSGSSSLEQPEDWWYTG